MTLRQELTARVQAALDSLYQSGFLPGEPPRVQLAPPKQADHGDYACTVALGLAKAARKNPREIAQRLQEAVGDAGGVLERTEVAGPGFLNLFVAASAWHAALGEALQRREGFLRSERGQGKRVLVEYVSANPTGPLHVAHGRGAVTGDIVARLLRTAGYDVHSEYYINDLGHQCDVMARSVYLRYAELLGRPFIPPEDFYPGEYIREIAREIQNEVGDRYLDQDESQWLEPIRSAGIGKMMARIKADLAAFGVSFDRYVSERELTEGVGLQQVVTRLQQSGHAYEEEGKTWFRSTAFGDDKDRVIVRDDGRTTYFTSDIAYHDDKLQRGHQRLINVWGADHGGYVARVKAGMAALGHDPDALDVLLVQMVSLCRGGEAVRMGKRLGTAVWLGDVVTEAGRDATRYFFAMRRSDAQLEFDIDLATKRSLDNPVYYAQMGHARMCSIARKAAEAGIPEPGYEPGVLAALTLPEELGLIKTLARAPDLVADAAEALEPHQIVHFLQDLIGQFHSYYTKYKGSERVISEHADKTRARLLLCVGLRTVLAALLDIVGVAAPESMYLDDSPDQEDGD